jgi:hypothetical protein
MSAIAKSNYHQFLSVNGVFHPGLIVASLLSLHIPTANNVLRLFELSNHVLRNILCLLQDCSEDSKRFDNISLAN